MTASQPPERPRRISRRPFLWLALALGLTLMGGGLALWLNQPSAAGIGVRTGTEEEPTPDERAPEVHGPAWFRDMTAPSGVSFTYRTGEEADQYTILETLGGGVALLDHDGDGLLDLFVTGGGSFQGPDRTRIVGHPCKLYRNLGSWKFKDVTEEVGLGAVSWWYTHGVAVTDFDRDGWPDLLVTGYGGLALFRNEDGRQFVDVSQQLGLKDDSWSTGAGWADLDGDGFPDLYVCRYCDWSFANHPPCVGQRPGIKQDVCPPNRFRPLRHVLFRNEKGKRFREVSQELGVTGDGYGLGVVLADLNGDGRPDLYVTNDMMSNFLYLNRGGKLEEKGLLAGVARDDSGRATASMGTDVADYDGSGRPSLFVTNFQRELPSLFRNLGEELFYYQSWAAGLAALGRTHVSWGTAFPDVDNDGWEDLIIANGHLFRHPAGAPLKQRPLLLRNVEQQGQRVFKDMSPHGGAFFRTAALGRGLAVGDLDNDGWPDLVVSHNNTPVAVLRNETAVAQPKAGWLGVKLVGRAGRDVVGSTIVVEGDARRLTRFARGGGSYLSASDARLLFGLGDGAKVRRLTVRWSWGETQSWDNLEPNGYYELHEGQPQAIRLPAASR